jgi:hypothetical protein
MKWLIQTVWVMSVAALLAGCGLDVLDRDERDRSLPLMQRAQAAATTGDIDGAATLYREALEKDPDAARGHLDLAFLLHDSIRDYVGAIYHYREYLRLRPDSQKTEMIENRVRLAQQAFAARVLPEDREAGRIINRLEGEISALHKRVGELKAEKQAVEEEKLAMEARKHAVEAELAALRAVRCVSPGGAPSPPAAQPPAAGAPWVSAPNVAEYVVKPGDTLSSIAMRVYGDAGKWRDIVEANKSVLGNSDLVKVGQRLRIVREE